MLLKSNKLKPLLVAIFVSSFFLCNFIFKKPLLNTRSFNCDDPLLDLNSLEIFSHTGCGYPWYTIAFFNLFTALPIEYYRFTLILMLYLLFLVNLVITFKIAKISGVNFSSLLLLTFLFFNFNEWFALENVFILLFFNLSIFFYLLNTKVSFFFFGFFGSLTSIFRPHPVIFILVLMLISSFSVQRRAKLISFNTTKEKLSNLFLSFLGFLLVPLTYLFNSPSYLKLIFLSSSRNFILTDFNFIYFFLYLTVFISVLSVKNKSNLHKAFLITLPLFFYISSLGGMGSRFIVFFSLLAPLFLLENFKKNKLLIFALVILLLPYNWIIIFRSASMYELKELFEGQLLLFDKKNIITDLFFQETIYLKNECYFIGDFWFFNYFYEKGLVSYERLKLDLISLAKNVDLLIIGPTQHDSNLNLALTEFNHSQAISIPNLDHDCFSCRHLATIYFKETSDYDNFKTRLTEYWLNNHARLCQLNSGYYNLMRAMLSDLISLPLCDNKINMAFISDYSKNSYDSFLFIALICVAVCLCLSRLLKLSVKLKLK